MRAEPYTEVSHDAFARESLVRTLPWGHQGECDWCGQKGYIYRFGIQQDDRLDGRVNWIKGGFCSKSCMESFTS